MNEKEAGTMEKSKIGACNYPLMKKIENVGKFLRNNGDDLPKEAIDESTSEKMIDNWSLLCDSRGEIVSGVTYMYNDWYLCTVHYMATRPDSRNKGFGSRVTHDVIDKMKNDSRCLVIAADVTFDNVPSKNIFLKEGFRPVTRFCWKNGEKPADIVHYVKLGPSGGGGSTNCAIDLKT